MIAMMMEKEKDLSFDCGESNFLWLRSSIDGRYERTHARKLGGSRR
jgi:hypothetical protein